MYIMLHKRNVCLSNSESIMHSGAYAFSKNGQKTIERLDGSNATLGNEVGFSQVIQTNSGCFPTKDMKTSPPLRSFHLDIKYAQCAENKDKRKISHHIFGPKNSIFF